MNKRVVYTVALGLGISVATLVQNSIYASPAFSTFDEASNELIGAKKDEQNDGRGSLIAIIDAGANVNHEIFRLDEGVDKKYTRESMQALIDKEKLPGSWKNEKIVYAYDYANNSAYSINNSNSDHGTHVAGIVAGNPTDSNKYARGVAPNAQLAIMRVFGNNKNAGAKSADYARAIQDSIKLGVTGINISLGGGAGISIMEDASFIKAIEDAKKAGIYVVIANGNDGNFGFLGTLPKVENPDYGVIATPAIFPDVFSVASYENTKTSIKYFEMENPEENKDKIYITNPINASRISEYFGVGASFTNIVYCGYGSTEDFKNKNVSGKVVLVDRGNNITFKEKAENAAKGYASMLVIANNEDSGPIVGMDIGEAKIAVTSISKADGEYLKANIDKKIRLSKKAEIIESSNKDTMSDFSAWGLSAEGDLKPDITAPGGNIYSSIGYNKYDTQSGTSMAAPQISGVLAVLQNRLASKLSITDKNEQQALIKTILMNTAIAKKDEEKNAYISPRKQGAGLVNIDTALRTRAILYAINKKGNKIGSINLGNISDSIALNYKVKNISNESITYKQEIYVNTDEIENGHFTLRPKLLKKIEGGDISLNANEEKELNKSIDLSELNYIKPENGGYIDGFIVLKADDEPTLSLPFSGFIGDFANLSVIEKPIYDLLQEGKEPTYLTEEQKSKTMEGQYGQHAYGGDAYDFTHLYTMVDTKAQVLGANVGLKPSEFYTKDHLAISPNGDGRNDFVRFTGTFLRSFKDMQVSVYKDGESEALYTSKQDRIGLKNYFAGNKANKSLSGVDWAWHGEDERKSSGTPPLSIFDANSSASKTKPANITMVEDGDYTFKVSVKPVVENASLQTMEFKIKVDTIKPEIKASSYDKEGKTFIITDVVENGSGIRRIGLKYQDSDKKDIIIDATKNENTYTCKLPDAIDEDKINVYIEDWANNRYDYKLLDSIRDEKPKIILRPELEGEGTMPKLISKLQKGEETITDMSNIEFDTDYKLDLSLDNEDYEIYGDFSYNFRLTNDEKTKIINVKIRKVKKVSIMAEVIAHAKYNGQFDIKAVNKVTKKEYTFKKSYVKGNYDIDELPVGEYTIKIGNVTDGFEAVANPSTINVKGYIGEFEHGIATKISYNKVGEEPEPENDALIYITRSSNNEYKDISLENPLYFKFIDKTSKRAYIRKYDPTTREVGLPSGSYTVELDEVIEGYRLVAEDLFGTEKESELEVSRGRTKFFTFNIKKVDKDVENKGENPLPKDDETSKEDKKSEEKTYPIYLQKAYANEYNDYATKPITFIFTNTKDSSKVYKKTWSDPKDYLINVPLGTYKVSIENIDGYKLTLPNNEDNSDNIIEVREDKFLNYTSVVFAIVKDSAETKKDEKEEPKEEVKEETYKAYIWKAAKNKYKAMDKNPIKFIFTNIADASKTYTKSYSSNKDYLVELPKGKYEVSMEDIAGYELEITTVEDNVIEITGRISDGPISIIFSLNEKKVIDEDEPKDETKDEVLDEPKDETKEEIVDEPKQENKEEAKSDKEEPKKDNLATSSDAKKLDNENKKEELVEDKREELTNISNVSTGRTSTGGGSVRGARSVANTSASMPKTLNIIASGEVKSKSSNVNFWIKALDGTWKYQENGKDLNNSWLKYQNKWFYLDEKAKLAENVWVYAGNSWFYAKKDGYIAENEWILVDGKWYYAKADGYLVMGSTMSIDGKEYKFDENGAWIK